MTASTGSSPRPLRYRDVFIFTRGYDFYDTETDASGNGTRPVSGLCEV